MTCWCVSELRRTRISTAYSAPWKARIWRFGRHFGNTTARWNIIGARCIGCGTRFCYRPNGAWLRWRPRRHTSSLHRRSGKRRSRKAGRQLALAVIDDLWSDYLANVAELRGGIHWASWGGRDPLLKFLLGEREIYNGFHSYLAVEMANALATAEVRDGAVYFADGGRIERGATWTYVTTDQPFGTLGEQAIKALRRIVRPAH